MKEYRQIFGPLLQATLKKEKVVQKSNIGSRVMYEKNIINEKLCFDAENI